MKIGVIEEGKLKGMKVILEPRTNLKDNEYYVEKGKAIAGQPVFQLACLICEKFISQNGCETAHL